MKNYLLLGLSFMLAGVAALAQADVFDTNKDKLVNTADVVAVYNYIIYGGEDQTCYDTNGDGQVNSADVVAIYSYIIGSRPEVYLTCPDDNHPHLIDLGLPSRTKWACCNMGATLPEGYGKHYAWGETQDKTVYNWETYTLCDSTWEKCYELGSIAGTEYDVARVQWGGPWHMPTMEQCEELLENTASRYTLKNGIYGREFKGANGGIIFLPAAGNRWEGDLYYQNGSAYYWSATQLPNFNYGAFYIYFNRNEAFWDDFWSRGGGLSVRPVAE